MNTTVMAVAGSLTGRAPALTHNPISRDVSVADGHVGDAVKDPRVGRGGRRLSARAKPLDAAVVPQGLLRELAESQIRRVCRKECDFDWSVFLAGGWERRITGTLRFRAVREGRRRGLDLRLTDIAIGTVVEVVRDVIAEWTDRPDLRPTYGAFCEEQGRRGEQGRVVQAEKARRNMEQVLAVVAEGESSDTLIADRLGLDRSTVYRLRRKAAAEAVSVALQETTDAPEPPAFPDPEIPPAERWPVRQFMMRTGAVLGAGDARYLADVGRCYEAEGRTDELVYAISRSSGAEVRDPWAYLQRCITQRGDTWTVTAQLMADVLTWGEEKSLEYSLLAIGGGQVKRPLPYLRRVLATAVGEGMGRTWMMERPVAMAVAMSARLAPELQVVGADDAVAAEVEDVRTRHVESYRRRRGRLPWEGSEEGSKCCNGLKDPEDEVNLTLSWNIDSSRESRKADATPVERRRETPSVDRVGGDWCAGSQGEARKQGQEMVSTVPRQNGTEVLEHGPCRHPLAALMTVGMVLNDVVQVDCATGCGHRLYSDRGPVDCPCHWEPAETARVSRAAEERLASGGPFEKVSNARY